MYVIYNYYILYAKKNIMKNIPHIDRTVNP